jgi:hypothetical protein
MRFCRWRHRLAMGGGWWGSCGPFCFDCISREMHTKETPGTAESHLEKRLKRLWVRIGENLKRLRCTSVGRWWLAWVSGARWWVLRSSKAANAACSAVLDVDTVREL